MMMTLSRSLLLLALTIPFAPRADANAPLSKIPQSGWYRIALGDFEVTALSDGTAPIPMEKRLTGATPAKITAVLTKAFLTPPFDSSVNPFLVNTGTKLVLIDTGTDITSSLFLVSRIAPSMPSRSLPITWTEPLTTACGV